MRPVVERGALPVPSGRHRGLAHRSGPANRRTPVPSFRGWGCVAGIGQAWRIGIRRGGYGRDAGASLSGGQLIHTSWQKEQEMKECTHLDTIKDVKPNTNGCEECLKI